MYIVLRKLSKANIIFKPSIYIEVKCNVEVYITNKFNNFINQIY